MYVCKRRALAALMLIPSLNAACAQETKMLAGGANPDASERFKNLGMELVVDGMAGEEFLGVEFYADGAVRRFYAASAHGSKGGRAGMDFLSLTSRVPERVRVVWRKSGKYAQVRWGSAAYYDESGKPKKDYIPPDGNKFSAAEEIERRKAIASATGVTHHGPWASDYGDEVVGDHDIAVGERIPQEVVDSVRKDGGQVRVKFRLSKDGVYFGWDIQRLGRPSSNQSNNKDAPPQHLWLVGGDFREAHIFNGQVVRKGWYIHPKTGQKIETDF
jgi:hypothetical protein